MFEFHRLGWIRDGEETSGWWLKITNKEQLDVYYEYLTGDLADLWFWDISASPHDEDGGCKTERANKMKLLLRLKCEKENKSRISMVESISTMERIATTTLMKIFYHYGEAYVNLNGGCRDCSLMTTMDEQILETCKNKDLVFPVYSENDVLIKRWPMGNHFYITVDGKTMDIDHKGKYNTIRAAEAAKEEFLKNNRFKRYREF